MDMVEVSSTNLKAIGFQEGSTKGKGVIVVEFQRGNKYEYSDCTFEEFQNGLESSNITLWFNTIIKDKSYKRL